MSIKSLNIKNTGIIEDVVSITDLISVNIRNQRNRLINKINYKNIDLRLISYIIIMSASKGEYELGETVLRAERG
jgi:hypothetical protein